MLYKNKRMDKNGRERTIKYEYVLFYQIKPLIPRKLQVILRQIIAKNKLKKEGIKWPIDEECAKKPIGWPGWPDKKEFAVVLTHDVETKKGLENCIKIAEIEKKRGFISSFNFVPERYLLKEDILRYLNRNGFEIGVHGLKHDGKLFLTKKIFLERSKRINQYIKKWNSVGFRAPAMHYNLEWISCLDIEYDSSTFDTDPFEPQPYGVKRIFPYMINGYDYVEMPYTLPQDFTVFILLKEINIEIWKRKLDWIITNGGMALVNIHPDYICFGNKRKNYDEYPVEYYIEYLDYIRNKYTNKYWNANAKEIAKYVKEIKV